MLGDFAQGANTHVQQRTWLLNAARQQNRLLANGRPCPSAEEPFVTQECFFVVVTTTASGPLQLLPSWAVRSVRTPPAQLRAGPRHHVIRSLLQVHPTLWWAAEPVQFDHSWVSTFASTAFTQAFTLGPRQ